MLCHFVIIFRTLSFPIGQCVCASGSLPVCWLVAGRPCIRRPEAATTVSYIVTAASQPLTKHVDTPATCDQRLSQRVTTMRCNQPSSQPAATAAGCNGVTGGQPARASDSATPAIGARGKSRNVSAAATGCRGKCRQLRRGVVCRQCRQVITSLSALRRHRQHAHVDRATVGCESCTARFTSRLDLQFHRTQMHRDECRGIPAT